MLAGRLPSTMKTLCVLALLALVLTAACGGSSTPTAPSAPVIPQIAGVWTGTFESTNFTQSAISLQLTQANDAVNGSWVAAVQGWTGTITGTVSASAFSGSITFSGQSAGTALCTGTASMSGAPGTATMTWTSIGVTGNCSGMPTGIRWVLQRR